MTRQYDVEGHDYDRLLLLLGGLASSFQTIRPDMLKALAYDCRGFFEAKDARIKELEDQLS